MLLQQGIFYADSKKKRPSQASVHSWLNFQFFLQLCPAVSVWTWFSCYKLVVSWRQIVGLVFFSATILLHQSCFLCRKYKNNTDAGLCHKEGISCSLFCPLFEEAQENMATFVVSNTKKRRYYSAYCLKERQNKSCQTCVLHFHGLDKSAINVCISCARWRHCLLWRRPPRAFVVKGFASQCGATLYLNAINLRQKCRHF